MKGPLILKFLLFAGIIVLNLSCASKGNDNHKKAELYFGAGTQSLMDQQYTEALRNLLQANQLHPNNSDILNNLAMAYYFKGEKDLAVKTLNESIKINKDNSDAKTNLASIYFQNGQIDEAEKIYKQVLKDLTYDKQARTYFNLGLIELESKKNLAKAEEYFKKSLKEDENYCPSNFQIGMLNFNKKEFNQALQNFKDASMGTCNQSPAPHYQQALTLIELKRFDDARLKLVEIDTLFKKSTYAVQARTKLLEINELETNSPVQTQATRNVVESPEF
jgi:type IV pilus assembly protein PilF